MKQTRDVEIVRHEYHSPQDMQSKTVTSGRNVINEFQQVPLKVYPMRWVPWKSEYLPYLLDGEYIICSQGSINWHAVHAGNQPQIQTHEIAGLPDFGNGYVLSPLRPGWLHVRRTEPGGRVLWYEYQVRDDGTLRVCQWSDNEIGSDYRVPRGHITDHIPVSYNNEYQIAYSEVQWSWALYERMENDAGLRSTHMHELTQETVSFNSQEYELQQTNDTAVFLNANPVERPIRRDDLHELPDNGCIAGLIDPFSIADAIEWDLNDAWLQMVAFVQSLRLGVDPRHIEHILRDSKEGLPDLSGLQPEATLRAQFESLHNISIMMYQTGFGTAESEDKIGKYLDRSRMEILLGKQDRARLREQIAEKRDMLLTFLQSELYSNHAILYCESTAERIACGKQRVMWHHMPLVKTPYHEDMILELAEDLPNGGDDPGIAYLRNILDGQADVSALFSAEMEFDLETEMEGATAIDDDGNPPNIEELVLTAINTFDTILGLTSQLVEDFPTYKAVQLQWLNTAVFRGIDSRPLPLFEHVSLAELIDASAEPVLRNGKNVFRFTELPDNMDFVHTPRGMLDTKQISTARMIQQAYKRNPTKIERAIGKLVTNPRWLTFMAGVSYVNLGFVLLNSATTDYTKENGYLLGMRQSIAFFNAFAGAWGATYTLKQARAGQLAAEKVVFKTKLFFAGGSFLSAGVSGMDAYISFSENNYEAGLLFGTSAVISVVLGVGLLVASWPTLLIAALVLGAVGTSVWAGFLEYSPLERFANNFLLRDYGRRVLWIFGSKIQPPDTPTPWRSLNAHHQRRDELIADNFARFREFPKAEKDLMDVIFGVHLTLEPEWVVAYSKWWNPVTAEGMQRVTVRIRILSFDPQFSRVENPKLRVYYNRGMLPLTQPHPEGVDAVSGAAADYSDSIYIELGAEAEIHYEPQDGVMVASLEYIIPLESLDLDQSPRVLFTMRYRYNERIHFPSPENGQGRYIGIISHVRKIRTQQVDPGAALGTLIAESMLYAPDTQVGTLSQLQEPETWRLL
ncbi:hypothetical protein SAMN05920897_1402 [Alkalispirochaeta americana]|uniref:Toxin VasX N-terminal region domain-containing protein n=1 Tax=Alkalispirochaeta americana TaxID=159291 RepID=A0A1N6Y5M2_9SPIO|nr:toxin VasX [Alkalispirochaeta americana]SIR09844.1 hypothetical protein SAMN05920897_1402 [Alkalispirochaeta americana]